jgi:1-aminocyclopropane-1-carboxylate deaminase/D-cysteine desulfhydrase-like pyridoxal-dependent ACC family enzyme
LQLIFDELKKMWREDNGALQIMIPDLPIKVPIVQQLDCDVCKRAGVSLSMLRLDEMHPIVSGNKWMKFSPWLRLAMLKGYRGILSTGGPFSNHLHAAAYATLRAGLAFTALVKAREAFRTPTLADLEQWGATLIYTHRNNFYNHRAWKALARQQHYLYVPMGGEGPMAVNEVAGTFNSNVPAGYDCIVVPAGTGTTLAGIACSGYPYRQLLGIDAGTHDAHLIERVAQLNQKMQGAKAEIINAFPKTRFGSIAPGQIDFMNLFYQRHGVPLDVVYTGKMMMWLLQNIEAGAFERGQNLLAVHTGGLQGNRTQDGIFF